MIRLLIISTGLILGLAMAGIVSGRMDHLRALAVPGLPDWSDQLTGDSGLRLGRWRAPDAGDPIQYVAWRLGPVGLSGAVFALDIGTAAGVIDAAVQVPITARHFDLRDGRGTLDLSALAVAPAAGLRGYLVIDDLDIWVRRSDRQPARAAGAGRLREVGAFGVDLGGATVTFGLGEGPSWIARVFPTGGALQGTLAVTGSFADAAMHLRGTLTAAGPLTSELRAALDRLGARNGDAWEIDASFDGGGLLRGNAP